MPSEILKYCRASVRCAQPISTALSPLPRTGPCPSPADHNITAPGNAVYAAINTAAPRLFPGRPIYGCLCTSICYPNRFVFTPLLLHLVYLSIVWLLHFEIRHHFISGTEMKTFLLLYFWLCLTPQAQGEGSNNHAAYFSDYKTDVIKNTKSQ